MIHIMVWQWVRKALAEYPWQIAALLALGFLSSIADGLSISLLIPLLSTLFHSAELVGSDEGPVAEALGKVANLAGTENRLELIAGLIVALVTLRAIITFLNGQLVTWLSGRMSMSLRAQIHASLLGVDYEFICLTDNGKLINTLDGESWKVTHAIFSVFDLFTNICMILAFTCILILISWPLTLIVIALVGLVSIFRRLIDGRTRLLGEKIVRASEDLSVRACELLDSMRMTRAFGREADAQRVYEDASQRLFNLERKVATLGGGASATQEVLYALIVAIILLAAVSLGVGQASMIAFLALLHRLQPHVKAIDETRTSLVQATGSVEAVANLLNLEQWSDRANGTQALPPFEDAIRFQDVSFSYAGKSRERRNALDHISFEIPFGKTTALVGASGAGKSTITNLIYRFHDPDSGQISVDNVSLCDLDLTSWRRRLAIAGQDTDLISGTVGQNISYSRPEATEEEIKEAARAADIHDFIQTLPNGYDTEIGERGLLLSGGQRQRIELARALLREDSILILDEATNALDSLTEAEVFKALESIQGKRTIIIIAHRLSTTRMADEVIVLSHGKVAEHGSPSQLFQQGGIFSKMVQLQELSYLINDPVMLASESNAISRQLT
ncbi:ABC transporter ATP-binding protein [Sphingobium phenoxybenzoativorans]|uniref:ABC transporter ATP-binding protein n=1 Tax=Sphingobium phenoxybenzoativorans TaxID=1592790 RepID=UPI0009F1A710|nr:ABC transporter ATP-binding protein [Sphingobium phenoxybenzoativorans]